MKRTRDLLILKIQKVSGVFCLCETPKGRLITEEFPTERLSRLKKNVSMRYHEQNLVPRHPQRRTEPYCLPIGMTNAVEEKTFDPLS